MRTKKEKRGIRPHSAVKTKLFRFTEMEEVRIILAIEESKRFMKKYGQGRKPSGMDYSD